GPALLLGLFGLLGFGGLGELLGFCLFFFFFDVGGNPALGERSFELGLIVRARHHVGVHHLFALAGLAAARALRLERAQGLEGGHVAFDDLRLGQLLAGLLVGRDVLRS